MEIPKRRIIAVIFITLFIVFASQINTNAQDVNRAGLIVQFGDGSTAERCVSFSEDSISGYDVLQRSGLSIVASLDAMGAAVCKIGDQGCPAADCFCNFPEYWSYWHQQGGKWAYGQAGSSGYQVQDGAVEGWRWGQGEPPSMRTFEQICSSPPTKAPSATYTQLPSPTLSLPSNTPITPSPSQTATPLPPSITPSIPPVQPQDTATPEYVATLFSQTETASMASLTATTTSSAQIATRVSKTPQVQTPASNITSTEQPDPTGIPARVRITSTADFVQAQPPEAGRLSRVFGPNRAPNEILVMGWLFISIGLGLLGYVLAANKLQ